MTDWKRETISSGSKWEPIIGYSRAVKVGPFVMVSGTTATGENGAVVGAGDVHAQTIQALRNIEQALKNAGAELRHVARTRIFMRDISEWEAVGKAHGEFFGEIRPCTTMVEISKLIGGDLLIEIEADAIITN